jgi:uncharacterized protein YegL
MRRLPVYLLLDTSGSMTGEPIEAVKNGVQVMISSLRQNPQQLKLLISALSHLTVLQNRLSHLLTLPLFKW